MGVSGLPAMPLAKIRCRGLHDALAAVRQAQPHAPDARRLVEGGAAEFRLVPDVAFHRPGIGLEPAGDHVLRQVLRPVRRPRQIGHVVQVDLVVQRQRVVPLPPDVPDPLAHVDEEGVDAEQPQPRRDGEARLSRAHDQHRRIAVGVGHVLGADVAPVIAAEVAGIGRARGAALVDRLLVPLQLVEARRDAPRPVSARPRPGAPGRCSARCRSRR